MSRGCAKASRIAGSVDLREGHPPLLGDGDLGGLGDMPRDRLPLPVEVGREIDGVRPASGLGDARHLPAAVLADHIVGREVVLHIHTQLALAGVLGEVTHMALGGEDRIAIAQVALDRLGLRRRLDDHQILVHRAGV